MLNIVFRVDASSQIGIGHFMRCLTLADTLKVQGAQICFICRRLPEYLQSLLLDRGYDFVALECSKSETCVVEQVDFPWLGVSQENDARDSIFAISDRTWDWLIIDHYALDSRWEKMLRPYAESIMVIDDLANRYHDCDVLLDQNYSKEGLGRYSGLVPDVCRLLCGPNYALLRPEYIEYRKELRIRDGKIRKILVFFGGSDPQNMTGMALEALNHPNLKHLKIDVVIGSSNPHFKSIEQQARHRSLVTLHAPRPHLADLMANADLALGAGGATTWERMCLGLPAVVVSMADNQLPGTEALATAQLTYYLGQSSELTHESISTAVIELTAKAKELAEVSFQNQLVVDGLGALRVREVMLPTCEDELKIRNAREDDIITYYNWANDPEVRKNAIQTQLILWKEHQSWFKQKLKNPNSYLYILEAGGLSVGQIRFDMAKGEATISYSLDVLARGRRWGKKLVALGLSKMKENEPITLLAKVKASNQASYLVFLGLGFTMSKNEDESEYLIFSLNYRAFEG